MNGNNNARYDCDGDDRCCNHKNTVKIAILNLKQQS